MPDPKERNEPFGAVKPVFATTHWSVVLQAGESQSSQGIAALEELCRTYWHPLYAFIRRSGRTEEDAKDLTQQFFARLLERKDIQRMDARKGKFRTFLLTALTHFLANERDYQQAAKRGGGKTIISLDAIAAEQTGRPDSEQSALSRPRNSITCADTRMANTIWLRQRHLPEGQRLRANRSGAIYYQQKRQRCHNKVLIGHNSDEP